MNNQVNNSNQPIGQSEGKLLDSIYASWQQEELDNINVTNMIAKAFGGLKRKQRHVLKRRYGIGGLEKKTLQEIGDSFGVTRERIRQIERSALKKLNKEVNIKYFRPVTAAVAFELEKSGGIISERTLIRRILGNNYSEENNSGMKLILEVFPDFYYAKECDHKNEAWHLRECDLERVVKVIKSSIEYLENRGEIVSIDELKSDIASKHELTEDHLVSLMDLSKMIMQTSDGGFGLKSWKFINPKNIRDKIFFVFHRTKKPMHFMEITDLIVKEDFLHKKKITHQAVHNELIADDRYVLIGKGIYALKEWGYQPGTVVDVIKQIIKEAKRPLSKAEIIEEVLKRRIVKKNTIVINLHNKKYFDRTTDDNFVLKNQ
ncbi:MAG: sigma factor-like helix-turn-helix DNA-binding protein [Patescibacteria group bacterium]